MIKTSRRFARLASAGVLGIALFAGTGASCTPTGDDVVGGNESTSEVCGDLGTQLPPLVGGVTASALILATDTDTSPSHQAQQVSNTRNSFGQLSDALRAEAAVAADPGLASALDDTADGLDAEAAKVRTVDDIAAIDGDSVDTSKLNPYCPDLQGQLG